MRESTELFLIGTFCVLMGAGFILWGDKRVIRKDPWWLGVFSWAKGREKLMKWLAGLALLYAGFETIRRGLELGRVLR